MPLVTRRRFLEDSLLASAAFFASAAFPEKALPKAVSRPPYRPNDRIRLAVIGLNGRGKDHIAGYLSQPDVDLVALCDANLAIARQRADEIEKKGRPRPKLYQDLRKLYDDPEIDAVSMALPIHWHSLAAIWAMQAGKDVYVEKPVCHNLYEGRQLVRAARTYGRICQAGTQSRSNKAVQDAIAYIHAGKIGKVRLARGLCYKPRGSIGWFPDGPAPADLDYDLWLGPARKRPFNKNRYLYNWHWNWDYGAGDMGNQGIHQMDIARWALDVHDLPRTVLGLGGRFGYLDQAQTPNTELAFFDFGDKSLVFEVRGLKTPPYQGVSIGDLVYGTDGYVAFTADYGKAAAFDLEGHPVATFSGGGDHFRNYLNAVRSRKTSDLHAPVAECYVSTALVHLGNISYRVGDPTPFDGASAWADDEEKKAAFERFKAHLSENGVRLNGFDYRLGRTLKIDSQAGAFVGDEEANGYLTRNYRAPFVVPEKL
jgi:predicted dehydrogenase